MGLAVDVWYWHLYKIANFSIVYCFWIIHDFILMFLEFLYSFWYPEAALIFPLVYFIFLQFCQISSKDSLNLRINKGIVLVTLNSLSGK